MWWSTIAWPGRLKLRGEQLLGEREADGVGEALAERAGGGLHAGRVADFGMAGRLRVQLAELADLLHRQVVAGEVQQRVLQHRAVAVGEHEAVAVGPRGIRRVVAQVAPPEHLGDLGHAHRHAGMAGVGLLHRVHGERADGVDDVGVARRRRSGSVGHRKRFGVGGNARIILGKALKMLSHAGICDYTCALFHRDTFSLG